MDKAAPLPITHSFVLQFLAAVTHPLASDTSGDCTTLPNGGVGPFRKYTKAILNQVSI